MRDSLLFVIVFVAASYAHSDDWSRYERKTLAETIAEHLDVVDPEAMNITPGMPQLVLAQYRGEQREISESKASLFEAWATMIQRPNEVADKFGTELLFVEDGVEYWLSVQSPLLPLIDEELDPGDHVWLYVGWIGHIDSKWVFAVNAFEKAQRRE